VALPDSARCFCLLTQVHWKPQSHAVATLEAVPDLSKVAPNKQEPEWGGGQPCEGWRGGSGPVRPVFEEVTFNGHSWIHGSTVLPFEHLEYHLEHVKRGYPRAPFFRPLPSFFCLVSLAPVLPEALNSYLQRFFGSVIDPLPTPPLPHTTPLITLPHPSHPPHWNLLKHLVIRY